MKNALSTAQSQRKRKQQAKLIKELAKFPDSCQHTYWYFIQRARIHQLMYMTQQTIANALGYCRKTINRAIKELHKFGFIIKRYRGIKISCTYGFDFPKSPNLFLSNCPSIEEYNTDNSFSSLVSPRDCDKIPVVGIGGVPTKSSTRESAWKQSLMSKLSVDDEILLICSSLDCGCPACEVVSRVGKVPFIGCPCDPIRRLLLYFDHFILQEA